MAMPIAITKDGKKAYATLGGHWIKKGKGKRSTILCGEPEPELAEVEIYKL